MALFAGAVLAALSLAIVALATHPEVSLPDSDFEIDTDANLKVDDASPSIDWASVDEVRVPDELSGSGDDSFGQGAKEDTAVPAVVDGSIPPNKSDLLNFGVYLEENAAGSFLNLFWHRVQEPTGTTNMDFEFNKNLCEIDDLTGEPTPDSVCSANNTTPVRTSGDILIQYDLSQGGTNPELFLSRWIVAGDLDENDDPLTAADCEAANKLPCWSGKVSLTATGDATGSINTTAIPTTPTDETDGLAEAPGEISPRTFGEAQLDFEALTGGAECVAFGGAYLKSRSSDSFTSALKDFIAPEDVNLDTCVPTGIKTQQSWFPNDTATVSADTGNLEAGGTVVFSLYNNATCDPANGGLLYTETETLAGDLPTEEVSTSNGNDRPNDPATDPPDYAVTTDYDDDADSVKGPYSWKVVYTPGPNGQPPTLATESSCDAENFSITYTNDPGPTTP